MPLEKFSEKFIQDIDKTLLSHSHSFTFTDSCFILIKFAPHMSKDLWLKIKDKVSLLIKRLC
jgi:hypothetical protein